MTCTKCDGEVYRTFAGSVEVLRALGQMAPTYWRLSRRADRAALAFDLRKPVQPSATRA